MATVECDAALSADSSASPDMTAVYGAGSLVLAEASVGSNVWASWSFALATSTDSQMSPAAGVKWGATTGLSADSSQGSAAGLGFFLSSDPSSGSTLTGDFIESASLVAGLLANSGLSCPGLDKLHPARPSPNPAGSTVTSAPRLVPSPPASPSYSVGTGAARTTTGPAVRTPIRVKV